MKTKILAVSLLLMVHFCVNSQVTDLELWTGPEFRYSFLKIFRVDLEQQFRFNQNLSRYDFTFTEAGLRVRIVKGLYFKGKYRYSFMATAHQVPGDEEYNRQRWMADLNYGRKLLSSGLSFDYRIRLQDSKEEVTNQKFTLLRNRLQLDYNLSKLVDPFLSFEVFYRFNQKNEIRKLRYTLGAEWKINKSADLSGFIHYQPDLHVNIPEKKLILGLSLSYDLN